MKNIILNSTYPNSISFSDLLVTVWFDVNPLIFHSKENFSDNFIFVIIFVSLYENKSIFLFSGFFVGDLFRLASNRFCHGFRCTWTNNFNSHRVKTPIETGKPDLFLSNHKNSQKIIKLSEKIPVKWRIEMPSNLKVTKGWEKDILFT